MGVKRICMAFHFIVRGLLILLSNGQHAKIKKRMKPKPGKVFSRVMLNKTSFKSSIKTSLFRSTTIAFLRQFLFLAPDYNQLAQVFMLKLASPKIRL